MTAVEGEVEANIVSKFLPFHYNASPSSAWATSTFI